MENKNIKYKRNKNALISLSIFGGILFLLFLLFVYQKKIMPEQLMLQGMKNYEAGNYETALTMFSNLSGIKPYDEQPIYYKALTLSKMPSTYNTQRTLHEISKYDDCEEASEYAENVLKNVRRGLEYSVGESYIDNVLYKTGELIRWNISEPITYNISSDVNSIPTYYRKTVKQAFQSWQNATGGEISFKEVSDEKSAKIVVNFVSPSALKEIHQGVSAKVLPTIKDSKLLKMTVNISTSDIHGKDHTYYKLLMLTQHQIAHALGLWGHSSNSKDVMYYTNDVVSDKTIPNKISVRDVNTLTLVYKMIPDVIDKPIDESEYDKFFYHNIFTTYSGKNYRDEISRLISQTMVDKSNIVLWVDVAINYAKDKLYYRSNEILKEILPKVQNERRNKHVVLYNLAVNYYKLQEYQTAKLCLNQAKVIHNDVDIQILEAFLDLKLGKIFVAKKKLVELNKHYPDNIEIAVKLADTYQKCDEPNNAMLVINDIIKQNPKALKDRRVTKYKDKRKFSN